MTQIGVSRIKVDRIVVPAYQRPLDKKRVGRLVANWNFAQCQPIDVARNADGTFNVIEGQHRVVALRRLGIPIVFARVHDLSYEEQAALWNRLNKDRVKPTKFDEFRAAKESGDPKWLKIDDALTDLGLTLDRGRSSKSVRAVAAIEQTYKAGGAKHLSDVLGVLCRAWPGTDEAFKKELIVGTSRLLLKTSSDLDRVKLSERLSRYRPADLIAASSRQLVRGAGEKGALAVAREMLAIYNKGRRNVIADTLDNERGNAR